MSSITRGVLNPGPTIPQLDRSLFPKVVYWTKAEHERRTKTKPSTGQETESVKRRGKNKASDEPTPGEFIEGQNGELISASVSAAVKEKMRQLWQHLYNIKRLPANFGSLDSETMTWFRNEMYREFPFLMLCEYHWKIDKLFKDSFPGWKPAEFVELDEAEEDSAEGEVEGEGTEGAAKRKGPPKGKHMAERPKAKRQKKSNSGKCSYLFRKCVTNYL